MMPTRKILIVFLVAATLTIVIGIRLIHSHHHRRSTAQSALDAFPCPTGDASCGNGETVDAGKASRHKSHGSLTSNTARQNAEPDSNPNQKIEDAGPGDTDPDVTQDLQQMNAHEGDSHDISQPK